MSVDVCSINGEMRTAADGRELKTHGSTSFPAACFDASMSDVHIMPHWHDDFEVLTVTEGVCTVCVGTSQYEVCAGQGVFVNAGVLHAMSGSGRFRSVVFNPRLVAGGLESIFWSRYIEPLIRSKTVRAAVFDDSQEWHKSAVHNIAAAWQACAEEKNGYEFLARASLSMVILGVIQHSDAPPACQSRRDARSEERVKKMMQYVHDHYAEPLSLDQICRHAAISQSECLRCFRGTIGITPMQYVKDYRLHKAASLLRDTDIPAGEVGSQCGFPDPGYFSKSFRAWSGFTPSEYRRRERQAAAARALDTL